MYLNEASGVSRDAAEGFGWEGAPLKQPAASIYSLIIEKAAEALYVYVFSGCDRLDGKRRWLDCDEGTRAGFRREAAAVLASVWRRAALTKRNSEVDCRLRRLETHP
jgi:hypothetical protein